jgi:hypothetical protein
MMALFGSVRLFKHESESNEFIMQHIRKQRCRWIMWDFGFSVVNIEITVSWGMRGFSETVYLRNLVELYPRKS